MFRGGAKQPLIRKFPNAETHQRETVGILQQCKRYTQGSETSQYLEEKRLISISLVAASESESSPNRRVSQTIQIYF